MGYIRWVMAGQSSRNNAKGTTQPGVPSLLVAKNPIRTNLQSPGSRERNTVGVNLV